MATATIRPELVDNPFEAADAAAAGASGGGWRERSAAWPSARGDGSAVLFGAADASDVEVVVTQSTGPSLATIGRSLAKQHPLSPARSARSPESSHGNPRTQKPARR